MILSQHSMLALRRRILLVGAALCVSGCSIGYITRGAYQGVKLLASRESLESVVNDPDTSNALAARLKLAQEVLEFAESIGLDPKGAYSTYVKLKSDSLSWILMASKQTSFELETWWFPIVGTVPYKGFFTKEDAIAAGKALRQKGYEGLVRPTAAFSSLGWFKDPILSTMTDGSEVQMVNTLLHELVHRHIWIKNDVVANESLANFIGTEATVDFYASRPGLPGDLDSGSSLLLEAQSKRDQMYEFANALNTLYESLNRLYQSSLQTHEKLELRELIFKGLSKNTLKSLRSHGGFESLNNAELMQHRIYHVGLAEHREKLTKYRRSWKEFLADIQNKISNK